MTEVIVVDKATGAKYIKQMMLPVPAYEIGYVVGFKPPGHDDDETVVEGTITGYTIDVTFLHNGTIVSQVMYCVEHGMYDLLEEEIEYFYPSDNELGLSVQNAGIA